MGAEYRFTISETPLIGRVRRTASHRYDDKCGSAHSIKDSLLRGFTHEKLELLAQTFVTNPATLVESGYGSLSAYFPANQERYLTRQGALS
jgi:hypothetical protein